MGQQEVSLPGLGPEFEIPRHIQALRKRLVAMGHMEILTGPEHGKSMWPTLQSGDVCNLVPAEQIRRGDMVRYWSPAGYFILHRVRSVVYGRSNPIPWVVCRGDANVNEDNPVPVSWFVGRVVSHTPHPRSVSLRALSLVWRVSLFGRRLFWQMRRAAARQGRSRLWTAVAGVLRVGRGPFHRNTWRWMPGKPPTPPWASGKQDS
ncbi:S26 family signal peptidase [Alicyclobacillus herbarius]|uniref:S26 family signal peptidase n=1 Tax=Alicyclobacillus herbarius TaxID=122960 RepID=UPI0004105808|nr:S26 family signal peptidase [Alicyclobacillus herbarius]